MTTKRIVVGAHYGLKDWLVQRVTAVVLAAYTVILLLTLLAQPELTYGTWAGLFASPWMKVFTLLALLSLMWHAWIGVRDIYMDYIKPTGVRLFLQILTVLALVGYGCWTVIILWRV
ncbi:MAG TPA: succinate dehydrogenase, hydrophobic membrane anchor protein [Quisquiliibacterium sp.]|nr:succinate dehydrogenase, hydrophobic membrane anchor protein [Quisquiliibacterium sp.]